MGKESKMSAEITFHNVDWDELLDELLLKKKDLEKIAKMIIRRISRRVVKGETATGRPLDQNSPAWKAQKLREGKPILPLQYQGGIRNPDFYDFTIKDDIITIKMIPSYRDIHLDLVDISERTGKNYRDWFGIHERDHAVVAQAIAETIHDKMVDFFGGNIRRG